MVNLYCFIAECGAPSPQSRVFKVRVGSNQRDQIKCSLLENYAKDLGYYFHRWDERTDKMLILRFGRHLQGSEKVGLRYETVLTSIAELYQHVIDGTLNQLTNKPNYFRNLFRSQTILDPILSSCQTIRKCNTLASTSIRKNLSPIAGRQLIDTIYCGFAVFVLFILGCFLDGLAYACGY